MSSLLVGVHWASKTPLPGRVIPGLANASNQYACPMTHFRLVAKGVLPAGDIWMTGFQVDADFGETADTTLASWVTAWALFWNGTGASDDFKSLAKTTVTTFEQTSTEVGNDGKNITQAISTVALAGTATDDCMPQETCPVISLRTANASKAGRGRLYLPPLTEASNAGSGVMVTGSQTQLADAAQNLIQSLNGASMSVGVFHRRLLTFDPVTACDVANLFRVQRRRQNAVTTVRSRRTV